jgi:phosphomethylpyrimidine synthase
MQLTQELREYAAKGMEEMSARFREGGGDIYVPKRD